MGEALEGKMLRLVEEERSSVIERPSALPYYTAVLLKEGGPRGRFYLQFRIRKDRIFYRRIAMFGGHVEQEDRSPEDCAIRELQEETGIKFNNNALIKLAAVNSFADNGPGSIGHLYLLDGIDSNQFRKMKSIREGRLLRLSLPAIRRRWMKLTPITAFAILQYYVYLRRCEAPELRASESSD